MNKKIKVIIGDDSVNKAENRKPNFEIIVTYIIHQLGVSAHIKDYHYLS